MAWLIPLGLLAAAIVLLVWRARSGANKYFAKTEYWVYLPQAKLPIQDAVMNRMVAQNPFSKPGRPCIGTKEGMLFSDVRTHMGLAKRERNPTLFRPDLFADRAEPTAEVLVALSQAQGVARIRYVSEVVLTDHRHVQFAAHMAGAVLALGDGLAVFDPVSERLFSAKGFEEMLAQSPDATRFEANVRVVWAPEATGGRAMTRGLRKVGLAELESDPTSADQQVLVITLLEELAREAWKQMALPTEFQAEAYGDRFTFEITPGPEKSGVAIRRILSKD